MTQRIGDFMETFTGTAFYSFDPRPGEIWLKDIAHSLSQICRFNGHTKHFYSVAQHSLNVRRVLEAMGVPANEQLKGLLHDGSEAYLCDIPRPLKPYVHGYFEAEKCVQDMIYDKFGVSSVRYSYIKQADNIMLGYEANALMPCTVWSPSSHSDVLQYLGIEDDIDVDERDHGAIEGIFLATANSLINQMTMERGKSEMDSQDD